MLRSQSGVEAVTAPGLAFLSKPIRAVESLASVFKDRSRALEENKALKEELYSLRAEKQQFEIMQMKLRRYEQILSADSKADIPTQKIAARAVSEIEGPFVRSALINVGREKGVKQGHPVMTVDGLYGHVLRAGTKSSRVLRLGDLNSRVSVLSMRSEARAILTGNNSAVPTLAFVNSNSEWRDGDKVVTSGDDGVLPRGLPVGTIMKNPSGDLTVTLNITGKDIDWVWVYPFEPIKEPEEILEKESVTAEGDDVDSAQAGSSEAVESSETAQAESP